MACTWQIVSTHRCAVEATFTSSDQLRKVHRTWPLPDCYQHWPVLGSRIAQCLEPQTRNRKVLGSSPGRRIFFSRVNFLCRLLFPCPFHPCVTTVAHKRPQSFCQKCRWQVTAKHACTLCVWFCMKWHDMVHGCMMCAECAETAAVSCCISHVTTKQSLSTPLQNALQKRDTVTHLESHVTKVQRDCLQVEKSATWNNHHHHTWHRSCFWDSHALVGFTVSADSVLWGSVS